MSGHGKREGGGDGKSSGELLHYLVPLVDAGDGGARAAPLQIPILFAARNRFCICPNEMMLLQKNMSGVEVARVRFLTLSVCEIGVGQSTNLVKVHEPCVARGQHDNRL